jgi:hypothetical protein
MCADKGLLCCCAGLLTVTHPCPGSAMKHSITVCLYFMPPQRAKEMDW